MVKKSNMAIALLALSFLVGGEVIASVGDDVDKLDAQRNELVREITSNLADGKLSVEEAQSLKNGSDKVLRLESQAKEDPRYLQNLTDAIQQSRLDIQHTVHTTKVWLGIEGADRNLQQQVSEALD